MSEHPVRNLTVVNAVVHQPGGRFSRDPWGSWSRMG